jgi:imidazolonepropionase-like amidohydrolase
VHATEATVIQNVRLFDGEAVHDPVTVIVKDGIIEKIADAAFDLPDRGRIKPGYRADLLLVEGDPTIAITDTRRISAIWKAGKRHQVASPTD